MRRFTLILLAMVLIFGSLLTGCGCGKKENDFSMPDTQAYVDHALAIKQAMFGGGTAVEDALMNAVTIEVVDEQDHQLTVEITAPQVYDRVAQWFGQTSPEGHTQQALEQEVYIAVQEAIQEEKFETIEVVIEIIDMPDTGPSYVIPEEGRNHASGGMNQFFNEYDYDYPPCGFVDNTDSGSSLDIATIEHQILIQTLAVTYYDMLQYTQADVDGDGTKELLLFVQDPGYSVPGGTLMTLDTDTDAFWCYSCLGAAEATEFILRDGQYYFLDSYTTAGNQMADYRTWADYDGWQSVGYYSSSYQGPQQGVVVDECVWDGKDVTPEEFFSTSDTIITYDNPDLHMQQATGSFDGMVDTLDAYLTESYYHDYHLMERTDLNGDGLEDCVFVTSGTYEYRIRALNAENVQGGEPFFDVEDDQYIYTAIALVQTADGATVSVSRIWPSGSYSTDKTIMVKDGALYFDEACYVYNSSWHGFAENIAPEDMPSDDNLGVELLDFIGMPKREVEYYLDNYAEFGGGFIEGDFYGEPISLLIGGDDEIVGLTVDHSTMLEIDFNTDMSMTAVELWENIEHTRTPWEPIGLIQNDYGTRLYYDHPYTGDTYTIDLFFDSAGNDANLIRLEVWPEF